MDHSIQQYNLIREPWIPVIRRESGEDWIAPWQITEGIGGHEGDPVLRLAPPRPDFKGALHELLIGLLATCFAPDDESAWRRYWNTPPAPEALKQAFLKFEHAFNLDGDGPRFMQDFDTLKGDGVPVGGLLIDEPGANTRVRNADHFIKRGGISVLGRPAAAMAIFTLQAYAPSGGAGHRTSLRGGGPLTTLVTAGDTLWERLWPNVETKIQISNRAGGSFGDEPATIFPWLAPTRTSEKKTGCKTTPDDAHPLQVYWGMPRRIRLIFTPGGAEACSLTRRPDDIGVETYVTKNYGIEYSDGWDHPLSPYYRQKKDSPLMLPMHPQPGGISYRHWLGLVLKTDDGLKVPARCVLTVENERGRALPLPLLSAFGYDMDNAKARGWVESEMPLRFVESERVRENIVALMPRLVRSAEFVAGQITSTVKRALFDNPKEARGDFSHISDRFWRETEDDFFRLLENAKDAVENAQEDEDVTPLFARQWLSAVLRPKAEELFSEYASDTDIEFKNMRRLVEARQSLASALNGWGLKKTAPGVILFTMLGIPTPAENAKKAKRIEEVRA